ncbi:MAG TPA: M23 family metallopeptidase, partial [Candidatus Rifleibacterium sp.]|nr:M23 family metallopeptidase [Candidatus Rifleibacterium sp.]
EPGSKVLLRPVIGRVSSLFGRRKHPSRNSWHFHTGVDIVVPRGTPISSSQGGKVTYAGWRRGYGLVVVVDHGNNIETAYAHCSKIAVKVGQSVNAGQRIAYVGNTGVATGSHLHFEVRRNGSVQNPFRFLRL